MALGPASSSAAQEPAANPSQNGGAAPLEKTPSQSQGLAQAPSGSVERPTKKRSFRIVPSLSSLQPKPKKSSTSLQDATDRNSRASHQPSVSNKRREGSTASSRRSRRTHTSENNVVHGGTEPKVAIQEADGSSAAAKKESRSKGTPKMLVFFSCCTSSGVDHDEPVIAPKKSVIPRRIQGGRATAPVQKVETGPVQSSASDARAPASTFDEKTELKEDSGQQQQQQQQSSSLLGKQEDNNKTKTKHEKEEDIALVPGDQTDGAVSSTGDASSSSFTTPGPAKPETSDQHPDLKSADMPLDKQALSENLSEQDQAGDAVVYDATAAENKLDPHDLVSSTNNEPIQHHIPPPPPLEHATTSQDALLPATEAEKQLCLLPPIQAHLKNRKCLVLDLDETLVHSSFKVGLFLISGAPSFILICTFTDCSR